MTPDANRPLRVLYSFPHRIGASRICHTAWQQVRGIAAAGASVLACPASVAESLPDSVEVRPTLSAGRWRLPFSLVGDRRAFDLHDRLVAHRLQKLGGRIDVVHAWPLGARRTLDVARRMGIPTVLERPNAHTRFAYRVVQQECERLGIRLPAGHEHSYNDEILAAEEREYRLATRLLCPSDFVAMTFIDEGWPRGRLARHQYGFDEQIFYPTAGRDGVSGSNTQDPGGERRNGLVVLFAGGCAPRKGLHYALQAWLDSAASRDGVLLIAGAFVPGYAEKLSASLAHPSVRVLGHRTDLPQLMRDSDILVLPSIEEGSALVTSEARGSGCVLLVSDASGASCIHAENALVHQVGDVQALSGHFTLLNENPALLQELRRSSLASAPEITWMAAGRRLVDVYRETIQAGV